MLFYLLAQATASDGVNWTNWIAPGSATGAVIIVVLIFLKHMKIMQSKFDKALESYNVRLTAITTSFENKITELTNRMEANEDRRMGQMQNLFDKMMVVSTSTVQAISELKSGFSDLSHRIEGKIPKGK